MSYPREPKYRRTEHKTSPTRPENVQARIAFNPPFLRQKSGRRGKKWRKRGSGCHRSPVSTRIPPIYTWSTWAREKGNPEIGPRVLVINKNK